MTTPAQPHAINSGSLYVGDLHEDVTEPFLYEVFREVGPIVSIRVCRDAMTRKSLGYAYVNFQNMKDADKAIDTLNFTAIKAKNIRIMWSQRDPAIRKSGIGNIFIKNLEPTIDHKQLYDTFGDFGNILSCKVCTYGDKEDGVSKGYGFVHFETQEAAEKAIASSNGMIVNGRKLYVAPFIKKSERIKMMSNAGSFTNVFVKNLDKEVSHDELITMFSKYGEVQSAKVMTRENGESKEFGFVNFVDHEAAQQAVDDLNGKDVETKDGQTVKLFVGRAQKKTEREALLRGQFEKIKNERATKYQGVNAYIKNLDDNIDDAKLRQEFEKFGEITSCRVMVDEKGSSRGFGFVCFSQPEEATRAITDMNSRIIGTKPLYVALAQRKDERQNILSQQFGFKGMNQSQGPMGAYPPNVYYGGPNMPPQGRGGYVYPMVGPRYQQRGNGAPNYASVARVGGGGDSSRGGLQQQQQRSANSNTRGGPRNQNQNQRGGTTYKYTANARNRPAEQNGASPAPQVQLATVQSDNEDVLTSSYLAQLNPQQQKQVLGDKLYPLVNFRTTDLAPKITGMLLDMDVTDILHIIEDETALQQKITEAIEVLKNTKDQE